MEAMHQPTTIKKVHHNLTCDGTDIELTRFIEYIADSWYKEMTTLMQFGNMKWDNGHDSLHFDSNSGKTNIVKHAKNFPTYFLCMNTIHQKMNQIMKKEYFGYMTGKLILQKKNYLKRIKWNHTT